MKSAAPRILIAGAGIGGLVAALALIQKGFAVRIIEQAPQLTEVGAGFQVSPNGMRVLHALGLADALAAVAWEPKGKEIRLWNSGQTWKLFDLSAEAVERYGYPYLMFHRADFHGVLADAVRRRAPDALVLGRRVVGYTEGPWDVALQLADGEVLRGDVLVGADGVHSAVRAQFAGADAPQFTGIIAWRGIVARDRLPDALLRPVGTNWVGPGRHVIHYFLRGGKLMNFVGIVERGGWEVESWSARGSREECARDFEGWHEDVHALIANLETPYKWALMHRRPLTKWSSERVTLLGDAAHPTLPFLAQGAVMAIEDGFVLARALDSERGDPAAALRTYEQSRIERTTRIVEGSAANTRRFHNPELGDPEGANAYVSREWSPDKVRDRYDWLFHYKADQVELARPDGETA